MNSDKPEKQNEELTLKEIILKGISFWKYLLSKWVVISLVVLVGAVVGYAYALTRKRMYTAELTFALEESAGGGGLASLAGQFGLDFGNNKGGAFEGDNIIELMKSRSLVEKAFMGTVVINGKKQTLAERYIEFNKLEEQWKENPELNRKMLNFRPGADPAKFTRQQDSLVGTWYYTLLKKNLEVSKRDKKLNIIAVKMVTEDEAFSKYFTEILASEVTRFYTETKTRKSATNLAILQHQADSVKRSMKGAQYSAAAMADATPNINPARQVLRVPSLGRQTDAMASQGVLTEILKNLELAKITVRTETPLIQVIDTPVLPLSVEVTGKKKGVLIGGILAGILIVTGLLVRKAFQVIMR